MKILLSAIVIIISLVSCKKNVSKGLKTDNSLDNVSDISGKWNLITDSSYSGIGVTNHLITYTGTSNDYFDFRTNDSIYIKEGSKYDTLSYVILSNSTIIIESFPDTSHVSINANNASVTSPVLYTPGGIIGRSVYLSR